ncbi:putative bifunctional diguanylate cyclase/phosphodiesterase [Treponema sp.]|uniref:putative bifunctional diguanylate cyclase/phosphodiesterase n=1 Tax=Treponema sp. TaxID=166 RepID=UPI003EFFEB7C
MHTLSFTAMAFIFFTTLILFVIALLLLILHKKSYIIEHDNITGLPAYSRFEHAARKALKGAVKDEYMILSLNADNFRIINDTYGILCGNKILKILGKHFASCCRKGEFVCRFYADNFVFLLKGMEFFWDIEERVYNMTEVDELLKEYIPPKYQFNFSASIYRIESPDDDIESMIDKANLAQKLYKNRFATHRVIEYTSALKDSHNWNREITLSMEAAFENMEFEVFYQPKFRFEDETVIGAEALIRWNNPRKGFLSPEKFIPLFENNGFIEKIDKFVLRRVCLFLEECSRAGITSSQPLTVSFNLSRCNLYTPNLIEELKQISRQHDIGENKIEVELTERIMVDNPARLVKVMNEIKKAGFSVSVDDFGAGYSSLNLLKDMPADVIKLDKEFLSSQEDGKSSKERIIISSVIEMAKKLNITTVAEGVETRDQCEMLKTSGCDIAQGFYYAKPMRENQFKEFLEAEQTKNKQTHDENIRKNA